MIQWIAAKAPICQTRWIRIPLHLQGTFGQERFYMKFIIFHTKNFQFGIFLWQITIFHPQNVPCDLDIFLFLNMFPFSIRKFAVSIAIHLFNMYVPCGRVDVELLANTQSNDLRFNLTHLHSVVVSHSRATAEKKCSTWRASVSEIETVLKFNKAMCVYNSWVRRKCICVCWINSVTSSICNARHTVSFAFN